MKRILKSLNKNIKTTSTAQEILIKYNERTLWRKDAEGRIAMTIACNDTQSIPKVKNAGKILKKDGAEIQIMHNGVQVLAGGYHGAWMQSIIEVLKGHHEPQEERVFYEILKKIPDSANMIELGAFWAFYSLWFHKEKKKALNICCEPDPTNLEIGEKNAGLNNFGNIHFLDVASGEKDGRRVKIVMDSDPSVVRKVKVRSIDSLVNEYKLNKLDLLHMDIQGVELDALHGATKTITSGKLRFLIVSTHHYFFSKDPLTHRKCLDFIREHGGHIISSHTVLESFSGDGLIAASFWAEDKDMTIDVQLNHTDNSLFRSYEEDIAILMDAYDKRLN